MLKRLFTLALFLGLAIPLFGQGNTTTIPSSGPPSSTACNFNLFVNDTKNGNIYYCDAGTLTILNGGGGGGGVTSVGLVGTANQVTVTGSSPITGSGSWTLSIPAALNLGTDNSAAGTVQLANGSASAHTIFGSAATTSNSILGPAVVVANNHALGCSTSGTVCTVIDLGAIPTALPPNGSAGGDLSGSYPNPGVAQVNGAAVPASALVLGSNSSKQLTATQSGANQWCGNNTGSTAATNCGLLIGAADVTPNGYAAGAGTANAQTVTLSPAVPALATGLEVRWLPTAANTTTTPTLAVSGLTAKTITKCGQAAVASGDLKTTQIADVIYDGTDWELQNPVGLCGSGLATSSTSLTITSAGSGTLLIGAAGSTGKIELGATGGIAISNASGGSAPTSGFIIDLQGATRIAAHVTYHSSAPTITGTGCAAGTGSVDQRGFITLSTGATSCTVTFGTAFVAPMPMVSASTALITPTASVTTTALTITVASAVGTVYYYVDDVD